MKNPWLNIFLQRISTVENLRSFYLSYRERS